MKRSLFNKIWNKHLRKGTNPSKLADDLGQLRGEFKWMQYDPVTQAIIRESQKQNTLVNQSKTNLIRLISQSQSPWIGAIDPTDLRIQRMRFGNDSGQGTPTRYNYYKITEPSTRPNEPIDSIFAGGKSGAASISGYGETTDTFDNADTTGYTEGPDGSQGFPTKIYNFKTIGSFGEEYVHPPSHDTLIVEFYIGGVSGTLVETLEFSDGAGGEVYTRSREGIAPKYITTEVGQQAVCTPTGRTPGDKVEITDVNRDACGTRLYYDYTTGSEGWKFKLEEVAESPARFDTIKMTYEIGKYNVINSIVPKTGYNSGSGFSESERYQGYIDWYSIISGSEYRDAEDDFIDDYSVTFSINMTGPYGNGQTSSASNEFIKYTEAFLFNGLDEMFSAVRLVDNFDKNDTSAFYISWTILAPLN